MHDAFVPNDFRDCVEEGIVNVFERLMVLQSVQGGTDKAPNSWGYKRFP
jgi:hypothetical protein